MKIKMWSLVHKDTDRVIKIGVISPNNYVVGFETKKGLLEALEAIDHTVEYDEEVRKIEMEIPDRIV